MLFEPQHSLSDNEFLLNDRSPFDFHLHIHRSFEYFEQLKGSTEVTVGDRVYLLSEGDAVLVFPLQPHSYAARSDGQIRMCIFSPDIVAEFYKSTEKKTPTDNRMRACLPTRVTADNLFLKKSAAYLICGEFERDRTYVGAGKRSDTRLLVSLLLYADKNFCSPCLLRDAALEVGYDYAYTSKFFRRRVGVSFREYVNSLRIIEGKRRLRFSGESIGDVGESCGFSSMRTFDREFRAQTGMTPSEYRRAHEQSGV